MVSTSQIIIPVIKDIFPKEADLKSIDMDFRPSEETPGACPRKLSSVRPPAPSSSKVSSSIPLPVKSPGRGNQGVSGTATPIKVPSHVLSRNFSRHSRPGSATLSRPSQITNKHTLEIQFINKKKRLTQLKKELMEKQKPVLDLYQNLVQIKKRLEELGKVVQLEEVKLLPVEEEKEKQKKEPETEGGGAGESISPEVRGYSS